MITQNQRFKFLVITMFASVQMMASSDNAESQKLLKKVRVCNAMFLHAVQQGTKGQVEAWLDNGMAPTSKALVYAIHRRCVPGKSLNEYSAASGIVRTLIARGAEVNATVYLPADFPIDKENPVTSLLFGQAQEGRFMDPLSLSAYLGNGAMIRVLLKAGASPYVLSRVHMSPDGFGMLQFDNRLHFRDPAYHGLTFKKKESEEPQNQSVGEIILQSFSKLFSVNPLHKKDAGK